MNEQLAKLFEGMELSEEFKAQVAEVFNTMVAEQRGEVEAEMQQRYEALSEQYGEYLAEEMEAKLETYIAETLVPQVEQYVDYATAEFVTENAQSVEDQAKVELAEGLITSFKGLASGYGAALPTEEERTAIAEANTKVADLQDRFDRQLTENNKLKQEITDNKRVAIVDTICADLSESQKERLFPSIAKITFHDEEQYANAVSETKASYFPQRTDEDKEVTGDDKSDKTQLSESQKDAYLESLLAALKPKANK